MKVTKQISISIRALRQSDLDQVMEIEPVAFGSHHWSQQSFINELSSTCGRYFAACQNGTDTILGYSGFWLIGEEAHITTLAVHPEARRSHVGERLLLHDIFQAQRVGARWMTLEVRVSNQAALNLYNKYGFKNIGVRPHYYQDNDEDALVLWTENIFSNSFQKMIKERAYLFDIADEVPASAGEPEEVGAD